MISTSIKYWIKAPFRSVGLDLSIRRPYPLEFLKSYEIKTILDIGAHEGGFADEVRTVLPSATLHSFEPVRATYERLSQRHAHDANFSAWNLAIGDRTGEAKIEVNSFSATSSFLSPGTLMTRCPAAAVTEEQLVQISTLDDWSSNVEIVEPILLKADVQGFEGHVLAGATRLLERISVLILEVSFEEVYASQPLFDSIYEIVRGAGFRFKGLYDPWFEPLTSRQIQSNAIFDRC
jgi:FkbM family methyltransferase